MPMSLFVFLAALGVTMVMYVRHALSRAADMDEARPFGRRLFRRGVMGIALAFGAGWFLPVPDDIRWLVVMRATLLMVCVASTTSLLAGVGVLESAARRGPRPDEA